MVGAGRGLIWAGLVAAVAGAGVAADDPARVLASKGLVRVGDAFVLPAERGLGERLDGLERLVRANTEAVRRRGLRQSAMGGAGLLSSALQSQRLTLIGMGLNDPGVGPPSATLPLVPPFNATRAESYQVLLNSTDVQINGLYNLVATAAAANDAEAVAALARQDEFDRGRAAAGAEADGLRRRYFALKADPDVQAALASLTRAENRPLTLGPREDHAARLVGLTAAMDATRPLTSAPGGSAPDYAIAALLTDATRTDYRTTLGRLDQARRGQGGDPVTLEREAAARRLRYVRSVTLLRRAYDALRTRPPAPAGPDREASLPPLPATLKATTPPTAAQTAQIRSLIEQHRAGLRAAFVAGAERSLRTTRVPLETSGDTLWLAATVNGGTPARFRLDPSAEAVEIPPRLAASLGLPPAPGTSLTLKTVNLGGFEAADVPARVAANDDAPPVLGAPALRPFVWSVDTSATPHALALTRVDLTPIAPRVLPADAPPPKARPRR